MAVLAVPAKESTSAAVVSIFAPRAALEPRRRRWWRRYIEVLTAAAKQFAERGYHAATTKAIADELGVRQASLYYYIESKDAALEQICQVAIDGYVRFSVQLRDSPAPTAERLRDLVLLHLQTLDERPDFFRVFLEQRQHLSDAARHAVGKQVRAYEQNVEAIFRQGVERGELRADLDPLHATLALLGMCNAVPSWWGVRSAAPVEQLATQFAALLVRGVAR